jgi:GAF domain-containing protein
MTQFAHPGPLAAGPLDATYVALTDVLTILNTICADLLEIDLCSIVMRNESGEFRPAVASDEVAHQLDAFQLLHQDGPTWQSLARGMAVVHGDLSSGARVRSQFAQLAARSSVWGAHAIPLIVGNEVLGALTVYLKAPLLTERYLSTARAIAHVATTAIVLDVAVQRSDEVSLQLGKAINGRVWIEQAKGIVAERLGVSSDKAFEIIRSHARRAQRKTSEIGQEVATGKLTVQALTRPAPSDGPRRSRKTPPGTMRHQSA